MSQIDHTQEHALDDEDAEIFDELYEKHGDAYDELAASENPAAPLAQLIKDQATTEAADAE